LVGGPANFSANEEKEENVFADRVDLGNRGSSNRKWRVLNLWYVRQKSECTVDQEGRRMWPAKIRINKEETCVEPLVKARTEGLQGLPLKNRRLGMFEAGAGS